MTHIVTGLASKPLDVQLAIDDLVARCGCDRSRISLMAGEHGGDPAQVAAAAGGVAARSAREVLETVSAIASRRVSGFGVLSAVGELGAKLSKSALASAADVTRALVDFGLENQLAGEYAEALRGGKILVIVHAETETMERCAAQTMAAHGLVMPEAHHAQ
jgi:hypothetical protein